jgi:hypothetical protein
MEDKKEHILNLLKWLEYEVASMGGDGDSVWLTRFHTLDEIQPILEEYNNSLKWRWEVKREANSIFWGEGQEGVQITTDENYFNQLPNWVQAKIRW